MDHKPTSRNRVRNIIRLTHDSMRHEHACGAPPAATSAEGLPVDNPLWHP
jgi:hypothetical protein